MQQKTATIAEQQDRIATLEAMMQRMERQMANLNQTVDTLKAAVQSMPLQYKSGQGGQAIFGVFGIIAVRLPTLLSARYRTIK